MSLGLNSSYIKDMNSTLNETIRKKDAELFKLREQLDTSETQIMELTRKSEEMQNKNATKMKQLELESI